MTDRTLVDGNFIKQDESTPGQVKLIVTPGDSIGSPGQVLTNVAGALAMAGLPPQTSNATINFQRFNSSGTWNKPAGLNASSLVLIRAWGAGGGGAADNSGGGGGGGGYKERWVLLSELAATETVTIGAGGLGRTVNSGGGNGGNSTFGAHVTGFAGAGGQNNGGPGGGGGGPLGAAPGGGTATAGAPPILTSGTDTLGQGSPINTSTVARAGIDHGGGGAASTATVGGIGGASVNGGGGGGGAGTTSAGAGGVSLNAGNGGAGGVNGASGGVGVQPGGGGGSAELTGGASSGAGGAGRVDVIVFGFPA